MCTSFSVPVVIVIVVAVVDAVVVDAIVVAVVLVLGMASVVAAVVDAVPRRRSKTPPSPPRSLAKDRTQRRDLFPGTHIRFLNSISLVVPGKDPAGKHQWFLISRQVANQPWKRSRH